MICCDHCFCDIELKQIIIGMGQRGICPICGAKDAYLYDTEKNNELTGYFDELINVYTPASLLPISYPKSEMQMLNNALIDDWNIFNNIIPTNVDEILKGICSEKYVANPEIFDEPIGFAELNDSDYINQYSLIKSNSWDNFVAKLKHDNRFHTSDLNLDILESFCSYIRKPYKKGLQLYRGRLSSERGFGCDEMDAPPNEKASAGRANAAGIRCLYLANDIDTTVKEVRAGAFDYISIGTFELLEDIIVVDLKLIDKISPFVDGLDNKIHTLNRRHLVKMNKEMGKTLRKSDSDLDYIPTQYICDFIKSRQGKLGPEYYGIEYNSTMSETGNNLAIFYPSAFKCIEVNVYKVNQMDYKLSPGRSV